MKKIFNLKIYVISLIVMLFATVTYSYSDVGEIVYLGKTKFKQSNPSFVELNNGKILIASFKNCTKRKKIYDGPNRTKVGTLVEHDYYKKQFELFNPKTKRFESMAQPIYFHSNSQPILLDDGRVFIAGATCGAYITNKKYINPHNLDNYQKKLEVCERSQYAEIYDPVKNEWIVSGKMVIPRQQFGITKLQNGRILITNGSVSGPPAFLPDGTCYNPLKKKYDNPESYAEIFDPKTEIFSLAGKSSINNTRKSIDLKGKEYTSYFNNIDAPTVLLDNGEVLVLWMCHGLAEIYNSESNAFRQVGDLPAKSSTNRPVPSVFNLNDGRVFIAGGGYSKFAEVYNPKTETFKNFGERSANNGYMLKDGRILLLGGITEDTSDPFYPKTVGLKGIEIFDPKTDTFTSMEKIDARMSNFSINLKNGSIFSVLTCGLRLDKTCGYIFMPNFSMIK